MRSPASENGQTTILTTAFVALLMLGFLSFAIDVGYIFQQKRMVQAAADAAAVAYAEEMYVGETTQAQSAANAAAVMNGLSGATVTPGSVSNHGNYSSVSGSVVPSTWYPVTVSEPVTPFFLGAFMPALKHITVSATATAAPGLISPTCVCLVGQTGQDLNMSNNAHLTANSCGVRVNSSSSNAIGIVGSGNLCAQTLGTVSTTWDNSGNINNGGQLCSSMAISQGTTFSCSSPAITAPTYSGCVADPTGGAYGNFTVGPSSPAGTVCYNSLTVGGNGATVTLNPGTYVINGGQLHFESGAGNRSNLGGNGVFFYLVGNASLIVDNGANVNLVAGGNPENGGGTASSIGNNGQYNGILFYQDPGDTQNMSVQGGSNAYFNGQIVAPSSSVTLGNGSGTTFTAGVFAKTLTMNGGGTVVATSNINQGTQNVSTARLTQ